MANRSDIPVGRRHVISRATLTQLWQCSELLMLIKRKKIRSAIKNEP